MSLLKWIAVMLLAWFGLGGMFGCSAASRAHWEASAQHTGQAFEHTGGAVVEGVQAIGADVAWLIESGAKLIPVPSGD